ncbi:NAD/NADP octopine/nopaline dehydrogenase family protein [Clostridium paraputrificum]|uniref:NAD/NADP octopine/nopaline dehydrogenase family protein n=1 Tax=Clostridium paraputrificum TaxID=29363 RepID=UPI003D355955
MNVSIIGAGNIGTYLATYISMKKDCKVWLHTSKPENFKSELLLVEEEKNLKHKVKLHSITSDYKEAVEEADYILITYPSFMIEKTLKIIGKYVKKGTVIGVIPGFGGKEYLIDELLEKGCIFFGTQRVPSIIRLETYGESVLLKQKNEFMKVRVIPGEYSGKVCEILTSFIDIPCIPLSNYLPITLSPSNPTMHPSRLYELFNDYIEGEKVYSRNPYFYEEWSTLASKTLLDLDEELALIFNSLNEDNDFDEEDIEKIKKRYKIEKPEELSCKINKAPGFQGIDSPMVKIEGGYIPDKNSRYFVEDIQFGLCIIKAFGELCDVETPTVDKVITWGQKLVGKEYMINGKLVGKDKGELLIPQAKGIKTKEELINYYKKL